MFRVIINPRLLLLLIMSIGVVAACLMFLPRGRGPENITAVEEVATDSLAITDAESVSFADGDWPGWRGTHVNGHSDNSDVPTTWDGESGTNIAWQSDIPGRGHSSPILAGNLVVVTTAIEPEQRQLVLAYDRKTGEQKWETEIHSGGFPGVSEMHEKSSHANSTAAYDGERFFVTFFNAGKILTTALDLEGEQIWQQEVGAFDSKFGYAPSPLIYKSVVIVAADNWGGAYIAALDRKNGEIVWRKKRRNFSTYSTPLIATISGTDQLVICGGEQIVSYNPANGDEIWSCRHDPEGTCGTVVSDGEYVFASGGAPKRQTICVRGDGTGDIVWENKTRVYEPSLLVVDGNVFGVSDKGIAYCWSAEDGTVNWTQRLRGGFSASPVLCSGKIIVPNLSGETFVFAASGDSYQEFACNLIGDDCHSSPAIGGGDIVIRVGFGTARDRTERLVCISKSDDNGAGEK